ncbi:hypothetical protein ABT039_22595 [Streptomyces lasiicapitis]|uniref:hypothetical protein n=1 Tax=Streptomyces lasiicapitis TaxID=1923961 RepID=UPI003320C9B7
MNGIPYRVFIPPRPTGDDYAVVQEADLARARVIRADEVRLGDTILADFPAFGRASTEGLVTAEHYRDPFWALPEPANLNCTCLCCQACGWTLADGPLIKIADGFPHDGCEIFPAAELLLVAPVRLRMQPHPGRRLVGLRLDLGAFRAAPAGDRPPAAPRRDPHPRPPDTHPLITRSTPVPINHAPEPAAYATAPEQRA